MSQQRPTFIDRDQQQIYYLGFDLLLVKAPVRNGIAYAIEGDVVHATPDDPATEARHASIRAALLDSFLRDAPAWAPEVQAARERAVQLATDAGLRSPPPVPDGEIVILSIEAETPVPEES